MSWLPGRADYVELLKSLPPAVACDLSFKIFCTPSLSERKASNHGALVERARYHLLKSTMRRVSTPVGELQTYTFEPRNFSRGTILMVHGWTSEAAFMCAIAEQIRRAGFRVALFDFPAHGLSGGRTTDLFECAHATHEIGKRFGPITAVVAHSFGCVAAILAAEAHYPMRGQLDVQKFILIASPNKVWDVVQSFADHWELADATRRLLKKRLERLAQRTLSKFTTAKILNAIGGEALIVHCRSDDEFPFDCAEQIAEEASNTQLKAFEGYGHRNVLFAPPVIRSVVSYIADGQPRSASLEAAE